jgi:hypothetical protein
VSRFCGMRDLAPTLTRYCSRLNPGPHQKWYVASTGANDDVIIVNTATGAIASCPHSNQHSTFSILPD